jgi:Ca2+:H+ antiporter
VGRKILWASLALAPATLAAHWVFALGHTALFVLSALALVPLAWLIGEATEHAGEHTGPGVGGFLNATFGNAPELIIALLAIDHNLPDVVRGSLTGSVVSNILLVLGVALIFGGEGRLDRASLLAQLGLVLFAVILFLIPAIPSWHGDPERHSLALLTIPPSVALLLVYVGVTALNLRRHRRIHATSESAEGEWWSMRSALLALAIATVATAFVSDVLVESLETFGSTVGLSDFFIATVIVAIVGNAAEHGGAVVVAHRGKIKLATEIAISSSAQVALLVTPAVALLSFAFPHPLPLSFRPVELAAMGGAAAVVALTVRDGVARRWEGFMLVGFYAVVVLGFYLAGDR